MEFVETSVFTQSLLRVLSDDEYRLLQVRLIQIPTVGKLIPRGKGLRKYRWVISGKGKSGGIRIIYYLRMSDEKIYMLLLYKKSEQEDLTAEQLRILGNYVKGGVL